MIYLSGLSALSGYLQILKKLLLPLQPNLCFNSPLMKVLSAHDIVKSYSGRRVVDKVSIHVNSGEVVGLLGPN